ncbi:hypothetical protein GCM10028814_05480 [Angustibacter aerolatus]
MCRPPAKRRIVDTSALRQLVLVIWSRLSSSLTIAVIAMGVILPPAREVQTPRPEIVVPHRLWAHDASRGGRLVC